MSHYQLGYVHTIQNLNSNFQSSEELVNQVLLYAWENQWPLGLWPLEMTRAGLKQRRAGGDRPLRSPKKAGPGDDFPFVNNNRRHRLSIDGRNKFEIYSNRVMATSVEFRVDKWMDVSRSIPVIDRTFHELRWRKWRSPNFLSMYAWHNSVRHAWFPLLQK